MIYIYDENWAYDDDEEYEGVGGLILVASEEPPDISGTPLAKYQLVETGKSASVFIPDKKK